ncbi:hypothetical protein Tco_1344284 [Tanacetum coccineum]
MHLDQTSDPRKGGMSRPDRSIPQHSPYLQSINGFSYDKSGLHEAISNKERRHALSISKLKAAYYPDYGLEELVPSLWTESESAYDISSAYVRSHMRILSVVSLKTFSRYDYTFLKEIVLRRADYKDYKISEADFKNLHPSDFKDLYLLNLQGKPYLDLTKFTYPPQRINITSSIYRDRNDQKKMMRETEVHKFSDVTLTRILEKLDYMVKDYELFKYNLGMENKI